MWNKELYVREQQDAYEFFTSLVDQLDEHLKVWLTPVWINSLQSAWAFTSTFLSSRKWEENRYSKTRFRESSPTRRSVKTAHTGESQLFLNQISSRLFLHMVFDQRYCIFQIWARRNVHGVEPWSDFLPKFRDFARPICQRRGARGQQRLLLWKMQREGLNIALYAFFCSAITLMCAWEYVCVCSSSLEDYSEENMHQISAQCSLYSPHALRLRLGKWTLHKIRWADSGTKTFLKLYSKIMHLKSISTLKILELKRFVLSLGCFW